MNSKEEPITVEDSDDDDLTAWDYLDDDILISEGNILYATFRRDYPKIYEHVEITASISSREGCISQSV